MKSRQGIIEIIHKSALKFLVPLTPKETYATILGEAIKLVKADSGVIHLYINKEFKAVYASLKKFYTIKPRKKGNVFEAFMRKKPIIAQAKDFRKAHQELRYRHIKSAIFIPLSNKNRSIGVLVLNSRKEEYFTSREREILKLFGSLASMAIVKSQLYDEVKEALEARDLLISMAAHEFRTPLTAVSGYAQLLYTKFAGSNTTTSRWVEELNWECRRLTILANELLEVERISVGDFHYIFKECVLAEIVDAALKDFRFNHPDYKILLKNKLVSGQDRIIGDFDKLLQVVNNLLDNAAKFSSSDQPILVSLKEQSADVVLIIKDSGRGIPQKDLHNIFEKFYRVSNHSREGMGLGLFLAKNIISQHGGIISISSKELKGTTVEIKLPQAKYGISS